MVFVPVYGDEFCIFALALPEIKCAKRLSEIYCLIAFAVCSIQIGT